MRVCIVSHSAQDAGAERVMLEAVEVLRDAGVECVVVFPGQGPMIARAAQLGARCEIIGFRWWVGHPKSSLRRSLGLIVKVPTTLLASARLALFLAGTPCDVVVTNTLAAPPVGGFAAALVRTPHVWWIHEFGEEDHGLRFDIGIRAATRIMNATSAMILVNSLAVMAKFSAFIDAAKLRLLYYSVHSGFDHVGLAGSGPQSADREDMPRIGIFGRIQQGKGQRDVVEALGQLAARGIAARLVLVGWGHDTDYGRDIAGIATRLGVADRVEFTGHLSDALPTMASCDVIVVASRCEAFGRVTVEAMKLGIPVVGARSGATTELIEEGVTGLLYAAGDAADLAGKLETLLVNPAMRRTLGEHARRWATARFTRQRFGQDLLDALTAVTATTPKRERNSPGGPSVAP